MPKKRTKVGIVAGSVTSAALLLAVLMLKNDPVPVDAVQPIPPTNTPAVTSTIIPTDVPTATPTVTLTATPTEKPTDSPTAPPTETPTATLTATPQKLPEKNIYPYLDSLTPALLAGRRVDTSSGNVIEVHGRSDAGFEVELLLNNRPIDVFTPSSESWSRALDVSKLPQNQRLTLEVRYILTGKTSDPLELVVDTHVDAPIITSEVKESSTLITGVVEERAAVYGIKGQERYEAEVDLQGNFTMQVPALKANDQITIVCTDLVNNTAQTVLVVGKENRRQITLAALPASIQPAANVELAGTAEPNRDVRLMWTAGNQQNELVLPADNNGNWKATIDLSRTAHGIVVEFAAGYADRDLGEMNVRAQMQIDAMCEVTVDVLPDEMTQTISGRTDPLAHVSLRLEGTAQPLITQADQQGQFRFDNLRLTAGQNVEIDAQDACGNQGSWNGRVAEGDRARITLGARDLTNGYLNGGYHSVDLIGTAQPNFMVTLQLDGQQQTVTADRNGVFSYQFPLSSTRSGSVTVHAKYADGMGVTRSTSLTIPYDNVAPQLSVNEAIAGNRLEVALETLTGTAEPGSNVLLSVNAQKHQETYVDAQGAFSVLLPVLFEGDSVSVLAIDQAGNKTELPLTVVGEMNDIRVRIDRPYENEEVVNGKLGINAYVLMHGSAQLYYTVENRSQVVVYQHDITTGELKELSAKNLQSELALYNDLLGSYQGYAVKQRAANLSAELTGEFTLNFYAKDSNGTSTLLASQRFMAKQNVDDETDEGGNASAAVTETDDVVKTDSYAFGLDPSEQTTFNPQQVYLTGWYWSDRKDEGFEVIVDGKRYNQLTLAEAGGKIEIGLGLRKVRSEFSSDLVPGVTPLENSAGIVVMLDLSFLRAGSHEVQLVLIRGTEERIMPARTFRLSESQAYDKQLLKTLKNKWR